MERRRYLALGGAAGVGLLAGCPDRTEPPPPDTPTDDATATPVEEPEALFVSPDGSDTNSGTEDAPLETIQEGIDRAEPGQTIESFAGTYRENLRTMRSGTPDAPVTITGPSDAVVVGEDEGRQLHIRHDHIHVTGLTFDGLQNEDEPDRITSYAGQNIYVEPDIQEGETPSYLRDITIKPHAVGNTQGACTNINLSQEVQIGTFEVIGPAGLRYLLNDETGVFGEIVYLGSFLGDVSQYEGIEVDRTNDVHIHHINNSAGHPHSNLVDTKAGTHDVTIEYCTDAGGAGKVSDGETASIAVRGRNTTVRWNRLRGGQGTGVKVGSWSVAEPHSTGIDVPAVALEEGRSNSIYGNSIKGFAGPSFYFHVGANQQEMICGNEYDDEIDSEADAPCSETVPEGEGIGHTGGDSPWGE